MRTGNGNVLPSHGPLCPSPTQARTVAVSVSHKDISTPHAALNWRNLKYITCAWDSGNQSVRIDKDLKGRKGRGSGKGSKQGSKAERKKREIEIEPARLLNHLNCNKQTQVKEAKQTVPQKFHPFAIKLQPRNDSSPSPRLHCAAKEWHSEISKSCGHKRKCIYKQHADAAA